MKWTTRVHEWLADRFSFIQYPNVRRDFSVSGTPPRPIFFKHQMPWPARLLLIVTSMATILLCIAVLGVLGVVGYSVLS